MMIAAMLIPKPVPNPVGYLGAWDAMYMLEPAIPPMLPTEISRPIPTARLEDGARLLAIFLSAAKLKELEH
jgi:hypothetical protein